MCVKVIDCYFAREGGARGSLREESCMGPQAALVEALLARSLSHPHIVTVRGLAAPPGRGVPMPGWGGMHAAVLIQRL